ncbi:NADPH-dependent FMN reductase [Streptomyces sp. NPDC052013]|uniref:NADPH-dependent FMN reductase n=1 Tax=Streptomyces sp. NPDC052013 TaxID=3365679 RepID=UPI0037CD96A5
MTTDTNPNQNLKSDPLHLTVILGSVREGRFGPVVADWITEQATAHGAFEVTTVDLADVDLPPALPATPPALDPDPERPAGMAPLTRALDDADAIVVVTPDYNRSIPASLKTAIDWHFTQWQRKAIGFVGYSGASGGILAIEHLRQIFGELQAHTIRDYVSFPRYYQHFDETGAWAAPDDQEAAAKAMLDELHWWAETLHHARRRM